MFFIVLIFFNIILRTWLGGQWTRAVHPVQGHWREWFDGLGGSQGDYHLLVLQREKIPHLLLQLTFAFQAWIIPPDFDHSEAEAKVKVLWNENIHLTCTFQHLVFESDVDGDGHLTKEEILEKYDLFVGSQVSLSHPSKYSQTECFRQQTLERHSPVMTSSRIKTSNLRRLESSHNVTMKGLPKCLYVLKKVM